MCDCAFRFGTLAQQLVGHDDDDDDSVAGRAARGAFRPAEEGKANGSGLWIRIWGEGKQGASGVALSSSHRRSEPGIGRKKPSSPLGYSSNNLSVRISRVPGWAVVLEKWRGKVG